MKWKPAKGYVYLVKIKKGDMFKLNNGTEGIHLESTDAGSTVLVISCPHARTEDDKRYYLGKQRWSTKTEVRRIK